MDRSRFLMILASSAVLFSIFVIFAPSAVREKIEEVAEAIVATTQKIVHRETKTEVIVLGDVMLGRTVMTTSLDKNDPTYPWQGVADTLSYADIVFANLENPIIENCPRHTDGFTFCADPRMVEGMEFAGVDVVTLANNHSKNYGEQGLATTKKILGERGIEYTHESLAVIVKNGLAFGFLGFEFIDRDISEENLELVRAFNSQVDVLILGVHWGAEYQPRASDKQRRIARELVGAGADAIVGHHPHWVQDMEYCDFQGCQAETPLVWEGKVPVYYSLGNFIFDQMWSEETKSGLAVKLTFDADGNISDIGEMPVYMADWAKPEWVE